LIHQLSSGGDIEQSQIHICGRHSRDGIIIDIVGATIVLRPVPAVVGSDMNVRSGGAAGETRIARTAIPAGREQLISEIGSFWNRHGSEHVDEVAGELQLWRCQSHIVVVDVVIISSMVDRDIFTNSNLYDCRDLDMLSVRIGVAAATAREIHQIVMYRTAFFNVQIYGSK
jgi:hypothetical protein